MLLLVQFLFLWQYSLADKKDIFYFWLALMVNILLPMVFPLSIIHVINKCIGLFFKTNIFCFSKFYLLKIIKNQKKDDLKIFKSSFFCTNEFLVSDIETVSTAKTKSHKIISFFVRFEWFYLTIFSDNYFINLSVHWIFLIHIIFSIQCASVF